MIKQFERLVIAVVIGVFIAVSIPQVHQRRETIKAQAAAQASRDSAPTNAGIGGGADIQAANANSTHPPARPSSGNTSSVIESTSQTATVSGPSGDATIIAQDTNPTMFVRWAMVVVMFVAAVTAAVGMAVIAFFITRVLRNRARPYVAYRNDMRAYMQEAEQVRNEQAVLRNMVMRQGTGRPPEADSDRGFGSY